MSSYLSKLVKRRNWSHVSRFLTPNGSSSSINIPPPLHSSLIAQLRQGERVKQFSSSAPDPPPLPPTTPPPPISPTSSSYSDDYASSSSKTSNSYNFQRLDRIWKIFIVVNFAIYGYLFLLLEQKDDGKKDEGKKKDKGKKKDEVAPAPEGPVPQLHYVYMDVHIRND